MTDRILISRTDSIGDVVLSLPMLGLLKKHFPKSQLLFLGNNYTKPVIQACEHIDEFVNWDEIKVLNNHEQLIAFQNLKATTIVHVFPNKRISNLAKKANIPNRIGVNRRWFHLLTCNRRVNFSRRKSNLHETQLNVNLLKPFGIESNITLKQLPQYYGLTKSEKLSQQFAEQLSNDRFNLILHPTSKGSAREWGFDNFQKLMTLLDQTKFKIFITGTKADSEIINKKLNLSATHVVDLSGKMKLGELMSFIALADGLVAASTGPLHIAAALGIQAIGLYTTKRPIYPVRWAPVGIQAQTLVFDKNCPACSRDKVCDCITKIEPERVRDLLLGV